MLPPFTRYSLFLLFLSLGVSAQPTSTVPSSAPSGASQVDSSEKPELATDSSNGPAGPQQASIFAPSRHPKTIQASEISDNLKVDGSLDEAEWQRATPISNFFQVEPYQGKPLGSQTDVRVLYNRKFLYIAAFNRDALGRKALRATNFKRDFDNQAHDYFSVSIDGFSDRRNAMAFSTNPYGTQRDLLSFDDLLYDIEWDGLWRVRTTRTDSGWVAEMAIPWQTLRYAQPSEVYSPSMVGDSAGRRTEQSWGINFARNRRAANELSAWSPHPRAFTPLRMEYAGRLTGIQPPPPSPNIRIQPYLLLSDDSYNGTEVGDSRATKVKIGGDAKWAINPNAVLDLTVNTDFAQADVDRQVNNVTRFSVFFPERRQFFLENASLFGVGLVGRGLGEGGNMTIQPFFSRTIGLATLPDGTSKPVPIDAGARFVYRSLSRNFGGMVIRQRGTDDSPATDFMVGRFSQNVGNQNRIGALFTVKNAHAIPGAGAYQNGVLAVDGFFRLSSSLSYNAMIIGSTSSGGVGQGIAGYSQFFYRSNQFVGWLTQSIVTRSFQPEMGFVSRSDVVANTPGFFFVNRGKWLPKWIRGFEPGVFVEMYHKASTGRLQELQINMNPVWFAFQNGGFLGLFVNPSVQRLDDDDFRPLGLGIASGMYRYARYSLLFSSDASKKISYQLNAETGNYYDGKLNYVSGTLRISPIPHFSLTSSAGINQFRDVGLERYSQTIGLYSIESRMAVNPRLQLISFFQRNTYNDKNVWNVRLAWEFQPLSFLYIVYNKGVFAGSLRASDRQQEQHIIGKLSYLKQF